MAELRIADLRLKIREWEFDGGENGGCEPFPKWRRQNPPMMDEDGGILDMMDP
jgi:hypothetical protein